MQLAARMNGPAVKKRIAYPNLLDAVLVPSPVGFFIINANLCPTVLTYEIGKIKT